MTAAVEAVTWATALDTVLFESNEGGRDREAYKKARARSESAETVLGMRFVRNHAHHAAELLDFVVLSALVGHPTTGFRAGWAWALLEDLDAHLDPSFNDGRGLYERRLEGKPILDTLAIAVDWFSSLSPPLPSLPPDATGLVREPFSLRARWFDLDRPPQRQS